MNPAHAISLHLSWKLALRQAVATGVAGNLDAETLARPDRCELGLWLESPMACAEGIEELGNVHRQFHTCAGDLLRLIQSGESTDAIANLETELEALSARLVTRLGAKASGF